MASSSSYGLLAEFDSPEALVAAVRATLGAGYRDLETFTPFPVEGVSELIGVRERRVLWLGLVGGIFGFALALGMQLFTNYDYPIDVGGRPIYPLSAFAVVAFELTVLFAALFPAFGMLYLNGLPRLHHPVFGASRFHLASKDRFFLCIRATDACYDAKQTAALLERVGAASIEAVPQ
jgi:hypothetical protein